jgi:GAF domain-containing protein
MRTMTVMSAETTTGELECYGEVRARLEHLLADEDDWIAALATIACELHSAFDRFHWTGFYRVTRENLLVIGPYQGGHGCLRIPFSRGVCGAAARTRRTQRVDDVSLFPDHIACSSTTRSEIVVPVVSPSGKVLAVLDIDSDDPAAFTAVDQAELERICADLAARFPEGEAWAHKARDSLLTPM